MSAILYNTSSSLVPKFQRHDLLKHSKESSNVQPISRSSTLLSPRDRDYHLQQAGEYSSNAPFHSNAIKNSTVYLKELCCSIYPDKMNNEIWKIDNSADLACHALFALVLKNFISSWYGTKIPTSDEQFLSQLFLTLQDALLRIKTWKIDYESLIADDIPILLSNHIRSMRKAMMNENVLDRYCELINYPKDYYPMAITHVIKRELENGSLLQASFLDSFFDILLFEKLTDKIIEPYYIIKAISTISRGILSRHFAAKKRQNKWSISAIPRFYRVLKKFVQNLLHLGRGDGFRVKNSLPLTYRYIFTFISNDILKLPARRPYLCTVGKTLQLWGSKSKTLDGVFHRLFSGALEDFLINQHRMEKLFLSLRQMLFPNDNRLGPATIILTGEAFEKLKVECSDSLWAVIKLYRIDLWLGLKKCDTKEWVDVLCKDKRCNKVLIFKMLDCTLAHLLTLDSTD